MSIGGPLIIHFGELCRLGGLLAAMPRPVWAPWLAVKGSVLPTLLLLIAGHALCDYPLQGQFLSDAKNHRKNSAWGWKKALFAHSSIHAGMVLLVTGSTLLAVSEWIIHAITDWLKCDERISSNVDQSIHYGCKILWAIAAVYL